ncbi:class I SAM-dependent methyltransferase [Leptolyngbya iicbica]|uniref:Class I SAM-dependent methyltransferase n=2 Tax=Cyanophyceae TaxID=3028117 RepID=A0A4Q7EFG7_9CYAN|nr:class I SAM-dependent methyltransferase [Leptolyngbya sp. LK]RZM82604.1 class I SAM-dependent methyltransferase [Leptolyngbya sp. LK]
MGIYGRWILPRLLDWSMSGAPFAQYRQQLLAEVTGDVLEIGFGTGLNLAYYPETVTSLTVIEPNPGMGAIAAPRLAQTTLPVTSRTLRGEQLDFQSDRFDAVVSTWTLCSIAGVDQALAEIHRVLKPGGKFVFIEHGLSPDPHLQTWQHRLTPLQKRLADGCHLDRAIGELVEAHFPKLTINTFYATNLPKVGGYFYQGIAVKDKQDQILQ